MRYVGVFLFLVLFGIGGYFYLQRQAIDNSTVATPISQRFEKPLEKYSIERLGARQPQGSQIVFDEPIATKSAFFVVPFWFTSDGKKVTGLAHIPSNTDSRKKPVIVQVRGYVDPTMYKPGVGTQRSAEVFASHGFLSLAPDFLGYAGSDMPSDDIFEQRFQTYTVLMDLLSAVDSIAIADSARVGIWAHSNGGQIALSVLTAIGRNYPTTLWAPVTVRFPYSILYYTDESPDYGKELRKKLAVFEEEYDVDAFAMNNYLDRINGPMQLHQGTGDDAVPVKWNDAFVADLKEKNKKIEYFLYPGADHNLMPSWDAAIMRDIQFFRRSLDID